MSGDRDNFQERAEEWRPSPNQIHPPTGCPLVGGQWSFKWSSWWDRTSLLDINRANKTLGHDDCDSRNCWSINCWGTSKYSATWYSIASHHEPSLEAMTGYLQSGEVTDGKQFRDDAVQLVESIIPLEIFVSRATFFDELSYTLDQFDELPAKPQNSF